MSLTLYFLRHGQTSFSRANAFCGSGLDPELTEDGQQMAEAFGNCYGDMTWAAAYVSPLRRAVATATPLCHHAGLTLRPRNGLKEIGYGQWEGKSVEEVDKLFHDDYLRWTADPAWNAPTGGETATAIARRGMQVVEEIRGEIKDGNVLIVSHKATIRIILSSLLGIDVGRFRFRLGCPVGSVSVVEFSGHGPLLKTLANTAHLDARLRNLPGT